MNCPTCTDQPMTAIRLPDGPAASHCTRCGGHWIDHRSYWDWHAVHASQTVPPGAIMIEACDRMAAKLCPACGIILSKFQVGHGTGFYIERCGTCAGMWFDGNEWEILQAGGFHDRIHKIFGHPWQAAIREANLQSTVHQRMIQLLGEKKFEKVQAFKTWLQDDPQEAEILRFICSSVDTSNWGK